MVIERDNPTQNPNQQGTPAQDQAGGSGGHNLNNAPSGHVQAPGNPRNPVARNEESKVEFLRPPAIGVLTRQSG